jgi:replicative DNA helicase
MAKAGKDKNGRDRVSQVASRGELLATRHMPESLEAEAGVLGSMIIDPECISEVVELLKAEAFYRTEHQLIFDALVTLYEKNRGEGLDAVLLRDELKKRNHLEEVGGVEYIAKILDSVPSSANVMYYAGIVKDKQLLRELIAATSEILNDAYNEAGEPSEKLDEAERRIFAVTDKKVGGSASSLAELVYQARMLIEERDGRQVLVTGLPTGYYQLDDRTCGLQNGEMIIIASRPSMGKTSLALNIAEHIGAQERLPVAIAPVKLTVGK